MILTPIIIIITALFTSAALLAVLYNSLVYKKNQVENAFATIDVLLQQRWDLIPNLVAVAQNYMQFEQKTLTDIAKLRNRAISERVGANARVELENQISTVACRPCKYCLKTSKVMSMAYK